MRLRPFVTACLLAGVTLLVYGYRIGSAPPIADEAVLLAEARSVSSGATPLFFPVAEERWQQPIAVYLTAVIHTLGGGNASARLASTIIGAVNVALVFSAGRFLVTREWLAIVGAVLLLITPAHWMLARQGTDALYPIPFVLVWLIGVLRFVRADSAWALVLAGASLGVGVYSHPTAPLVMVWLWIMTVVAVFGGRRTRLRGLLAFGGAFGVALLPAIAWFAMFPASYDDTFGRWAALRAHIRFPMEGLRAQVNWNTLSNRASIFWGLLDPSFLFFTAKGAAIAPFLAVLAILVPLGALSLLASAQTVTRVSVLSALLVPIAIASTFGTPQNLSNAAPMIALAALVACVGLDALPSRRRAWAWLSAALALLSCVQLSALL